jgi:hypothetical protein
LRLLTSFETATLGGKFTSRCMWLAFPLNSAGSVSKSAQTARMISPSRVRCRSLNTVCWYFVTKTECAYTAKHSAYQYERPEISHENNRIE